MQTYLYELRLAGVVTGIAEGGLHARPLDQWVLALEQNSNLGTGVFVPWIEVLCAGVGLRVVTSLSLIIALSSIVGIQSLVVPI